MPYSFHRQSVASRESVVANGEHSLKQGKVGACTDVNIILVYRLKLKCRRELANKCLYYVFLGYCTVLLLLVLIIK